MINSRIFRVFVMQRNPPEDKNVVWFDSEERLLKIYKNGKWEVYSPNDALLISKQDLTDKQKAQARQNIGALSSEDGAVGNDNIASGAVTNDKICSEAITIDKLELDLEAMVSDNVKYRKQNLTIEQKAQARKNIDVDYLTEDEVANLWDTTK